MSIIERVLPSLDVHELWVSLPSLCEVKNKNPIECGFEFEKNLKNFLTRLGYIQYQTTRITGLSGLEHQYDAIFLRDLALRNKLILFECKRREDSHLTSRYDVMIFNQKALDIFPKIRKRKEIDLYRIFVSAAALTNDAFRLCLSLGILALQPYKRGKSFPPIEAAITQLNKALAKSRSAETQYLLKSCRDLRKNIFYGCRSMRPLYRGDFLYSKYKELIARTSLEVNQDWSDP